MKVYAESIEKLKEIIHKNFKNEVVDFEVGLKKQSLRHLKFRKFLATQFILEKQYVEIFKA